ncbi:glycosyltransferase family 2 protein [Halorubrum sp. AD140]|uniref:glycosyltransferase family 2 protein n=1 Tax=Halorubrum sp. AD140 TaxID=3050073 RepID=UPI002ACC9A20|nr:glycosyltransferase family 2 protein [Halorubrum sp. AD140]MDZ5810524.1 glycosyltransferase family 2 protein [Halorubrum sp. AD140]
MKTDSPPVGIIILNWNNYADTKECLNSLKNQSYDNYEVYVVDNNSSDDSSYKLEQEFKNHTFIYNSENVGFSAGNNKGIKKALNDGVEYVLILNNDATLLENTIIELVRAAESSKRVAIVGGVLRYKRNGKIYTAGGDFRSTLVKFSNNTKPEDGLYQTEFVTGAMMLLSRDFLLSHGLLNENYFFGMEDIEITWKARQNGWNVLINPDAIGYHEKGASGGAGKFRYYHSTRNRLIFASDNLLIHQYICFILFFTFSRIFRFIQWLITFNSELITSTMLAVFDYIRGSSPKRMYLLEDKYS